MDSNNWLSQLQQNGYRLTEARKAVVDLVAASSRALTPAEKRPSRRLCRQRLFLVYPPPPIPTNWNASARDLGFLNA